MNKVKNMVNQLYEIANLEPGFDIEKLVVDLGGTIEYVYSPNMDAYIQKYGNAFEIVLDKSKPRSRQRFSIAHELGHLLIHLHYFDRKIWNSLKDVDTRIYRYGYDQFEREANEFAAELLMPELDFVNYLEKFSNEEFYDLSSIARHFAVSKDAVNYRGYNLGIWSI